MRIVLLGVRGSTPAPGPAHVRYGGHTSCIAVAEGTSPPSLVLDAGTGIRGLGDLLPAAFRGSVVLTHLHWDHVQGLPFADTLLGDDAVVEVVVPTRSGDDPLETLSVGFRPPSFPVTPDQLGPGWTFRAAPAVLVGDGWTLRTAPVAHKGGPTLGLRVEADGRTLAYLPDHDLADPDPVAVALAAGADVLLHDAQYLASEIRPFRGFGHSTVENACLFADAAGVGRLLLVHHAPGRTDDELDALAARLPATPGGIPVQVAREGDELEV